MKSEKKQIRFNEILTMLYTILMLCFFPLFYRNNYIDILRAKRDFFLAATGIFLLLWVLTVMILKWKKKPQSCVGVQKNRQNKGWYVWGIIYLSGLAGGWLFSPYKRDCFWGLQGRYLGVLALAMGVWISWILARDLKRNKVLAGAAALSSGSIFVLQILDEWKIDLLGMKSNLVERQHPVFSSTIGNRNFNATFNCMMIGTAMAVFVLCRKTYSRILCGIWLILGFAAAFCCRSDSVFLGVGTVFLVFFWYVLKQKICWRDFMILATLFVAAAGMVAVFYSGLKKRAYEMEGAAGILLRPEILCAEIVGILALLGLFFYMEKQTMTGEKQKICRCLQRIYLRISGGVLLILATCFYLANKNGAELAEESWLQLFRITKYWGGNRGYVWRRSLELFGEYSWFQKLFGCGANCFSYWFQGAFGHEVSSVKNQVFIDAHSEYLQMLMTTGIVGCIGYFGMIAATLVNCIRNMKKRGKEQSLPGIVFLSAFLAQGLLNNPQIATTPLLFVWMGMIWGMSKYENKS